MKRLLINIDYGDHAGKFWQESVIKNKIILFDSNELTIHQLIQELCKEEDYIELSYKAVPQGNVHIDISKEESKLVGYMYRGKGDVEGKKVLFNVWVTIYEVIDFKIQDYDN